MKVRGCNGFKINDNLMVLITVPARSVQGGVTAYFQSMQGKIPMRPMYFEVGRVSGDEGMLALIQRLIKTNLDFLNALRSERPDVVHINPSLASKSLFRDGLLLLIATFFGQPVVVFFHGWNPATETSIKNSSLYAFLFKKVFWRADAIIVLARSFKASTLFSGYDGEIFVETTVVDDSLMRSGGEFEVYSCTRDQNHLLFMARIEREKGIHIAIDAFKIAQEKRPDLRLTVAGAGSDLESAKQQVSRLGISGVEFVGYVSGDEKNTVLESAAIMLLPSFHGEGMPQSVLEAMAFRIPVITRPVGGLNDFFENGKMGLLIESTEPGDFAEGILALCDDIELRQAIGEYSHAYAKTHFATGAAANRIANIYKSVHAAAHE